MNFDCLLLEIVMIGDHYAGVLGVGQQLELLVEWESRGCEPQSLSADGDTNE